MPTSISRFGTTRALRSSVLRIVLPNISSDDDSEKERFEIRDSRFDHDGCFDAAVGKHLRVFMAASSLITNDERASSGSCYAITPESRYLNLVTMGSAGA
jgi:hypothetical protein